jgi:hypothetical protein
MEQHSIDISVLSLDNPWLSFLVTKDDQAKTAQIAESTTSD